MKFYSPAGPDEHLVQSPLTKSPPPESVTRSRKTFKLRLTAVCLSVELFGENYSTVYPCMSPDKIWKWASCKGLEEKHLHVECCRLAGDFTQSSILCWAFWRWKSCSETVTLPCWRVFLWLSVIFVLEVLNKQVFLSLDNKVTPVKSRNQHLALDLPKLRMGFVNVIVNVCGHWSSCMDNAQSLLGSGWALGVPSDRTRSHQVMTPSMENSQKTFCEIFGRAPSPGVTHLSEFRGSDAGPLYLLTFLACSFVPFSMLCAVPKDVSPDVSRGAADVQSR